MSILPATLFAFIRQDQGAVQHAQTTIEAISAVLSIIARAPYLHMSQVDIIPPNKNP
ncbi:hypothetical protein [Acinetobacter pragensis]|uniref:hypothetical protein n=1 Tax=Acinetobacter pragensis TaxID=1806892 RepID=UPI0033413447